MKESLATFRKAVNESADLKEKLKGGKDLVELGNGNRPLGTRAETGVGSILTVAGGEGTSRTSGILTRIGISTLGTTGIVLGGTLTTREIPFR